MPTDDRVLLISPTDDDSSFPLVLQRPDGEHIASTTTGPSTWIAAVREREWDYVVCRPELLREHAFERGQREVLELIASGAPLGKLLEQIVLLIEAQAPHMICSILLFDAARQVVHTGAAPHLPAEFVRAIDGAMVGPAAGSCGTAAFRNEQVIVEDIATHPYWAEYRHLALPYGLRACWSSPIRSTSQQVLGTFAMYYQESRIPRPEEIHWVERASHIAAIAIERELASSNEHLHAVVHDLIADVVFYLAVEDGGRCRFLSINPAFLRATGLREQDIVGRTIEEVLPKEALPAMLAHGLAAVSERRTVERYQMSPYPAGVKHGLVTMTPITTIDGHCTNLLGTIHDITELHVAHQRIAAQAELLDRAHDAILVWDLDGTIRYWNNAAEQLYGWPRAEAEGQRVGPLIHRDLRRFEVARRRLLETDSWRGELTQHTRTGDALISEISWSLLRDEQGEPKSVLAIHTDITKRRKLELQVYRAQRLESLGMMAGGIAHDVNNILTIISTHAGLARAAPGTAEARDALTQIEHASERGAELVRQLLTFSRRREPKRERIELPQIVDEVLRLLRASLPRSVEVRTSFAADVPPIFADATQLHQVIINLITNAAHAMTPDGGVLDVGVDRIEIANDAAAQQLGLRPGVYARARISDTGIGMSESTLEHIFEPFFTTRRGGQGTGLGLSVVHGIVESHDGAILVHSTLGSGTEFEVYLPAAASA